MYDISDRYVHQHSVLLSRQITYTRRALSRSRRAAAAAADSGSSARRRRLSGPVRRGVERANGDITLYVTTEIVTARHFCSSCNHWTTGRPRRSSVEKG